MTIEYTYVPITVSEEIRNQTEKADNLIAYRLSQEGRAEKRVVIPLFCMEKSDYHFSRVKK